MGTSSCAHFCRSLRFRARTINELRCDTEAKTRPIEKDDGSDKPHLVRYYGVVCMCTVSSHHDNNYAVSTTALLRMGIIPHSYIHIHRNHT